MRPRALVICLPKRSLGKRLDLGLIREETHTPEQIIKSRCYDENTGIPKESSRPELFAPRLSVVGYDLVQKS